LYQIFIERVKENLGSDKAKTGIFGAMMEVRIINDGPVTIIVESKNNDVAKKIIQLGGTEKNTKKIRRRRESNDFK